MSLTLDWPTDPALRPERFELAPQSNVAVSVSPTVGTISRTVFPGIRLQVNMQFSEASFEIQHAREAFFWQFEGQANLVRLWHMGREEPHGTLREPLQVNAPAVRGDRSVSIIPGSGGAGGSLRVGDMLGIDGQLLMVTADVVMSGAGGQVSVVTGLRNDVSAGAVVTVVRPTATFMLASPTVNVPYGMDRGDPFAVQLLEYY